MRLSFIAPLLCALVSPAVASAEPAKPIAPSTTTTTTDFDFAMYGALHGKQGNLFFSGASVRQALGAAYLGARGTTASEMSSALHFDADRAKSGADAKGEIAAWQSAKGASQLNIANRLWADKAFTMNAGYVQSANDSYGSPVAAVDFVHAPDASRITINDWVAKQTNDKIKDLLPPPSVTADTRLVITNAIWFKGTWTHTFDKKATHDAPFHVDASTNVSVPTMHQTASFRYAAPVGAGVKILELPYGRSDLAMDVILPDDANGLSKIEESLTPGTFAKWTSTMSQREVVVSLPKFTFTWSGSMKPELTKLGMSTAFSASKADFTGIASAAAAGGNLYVSDVVHKAFVAVDEEGTEAAAATGVVFARETAIMQQTTFDADHPFVFAIRDVKNGRILFMGRLANPKA